MAVRRLSPDQPASFAFTPENAAWAKATIANYPPGKQASAVIPLLWRAQEQHGGWLPEPALRLVADMLGMAYIRVYEIATFYTMFQLAPVGRKPTCGCAAPRPACCVAPRRWLKSAATASTTNRITSPPTATFHGRRSSALGVCANAPMVQIGKDTYEDLTPELFEKVLDGYARGNRLRRGHRSGARRPARRVGRRRSRTTPRLRSRG